MSDPRTGDDITIDLAGELSTDDGDGGDSFDQLAEDFAARCRKGESPSIADYEARHPEHAERIRKLLPTVAMMEQLKRNAASQNKEPARPAPERMGDYRILREIGRGGMGVVYEAVQESLGRHVALKVVHHAHLDARRLLRFQREAQAVAQLHHTNIVPIFGVGEHEGLPYYAMQYIRGDGLEVLLNSWRGDKTPAGEERRRFVARIGQQAAEALQYAHEQGILHRDIKPANLLLDEHRTVWITDFGLAKLAGQEDLTASGDVIGTLRYLAPEALQGETGARSDVYSLGLTLYELLTLNPPFGDVTPSQLLHQVSDGQIARPRSLDPSIPADLETIVLKAIAREPEDRYASAAELADDLRRYLEDRPILARRATPVERLRRWSRRNRTTAALIAIAAASLVLAAVVGWVGYASTTRALAGESARRREAEQATKRADENVALSLEVFGKLFEKLTPKEDPFPPPTGRSARPLASEPGGRFGMPPDGANRRPPPDGDRPPPPPDGEPFAPGRKPMMGGGMMGGGPARRAMAQADTELLQTVLTFYERFASSNEMNPKLQGEAARAYFKVGALYERLGKDDKAETAFKRAAETFEGLIARFPDDPAFRLRLVEIAIMADPWSANPASLDRLEGRLRRARSLIDALAAEDPANRDYAESQIHVHAKLGSVLHRRGRAAEAEACYRRAIALEGALVERSQSRNDAGGRRESMQSFLLRSPGGERARLDRIDTREALAALLIEDGRKQEAGRLLDEAVEDLRVLSLAEALAPPVADRLKVIGEGFRRIGDEARASALEVQAAALSAQSRPRGREIGPMRKDRNLR